MRVREKCKEVNALFANRRFGGRVGVVNAVKERRERVVSEGFCNGVKFGRGEC